MDISVGYKYLPRLHLLILLAGIERRQLIFLQIVCQTLRSRAGTRQQNHSRLVPLPFLQIRNQHFEAVLVGIHVLRRQEESPGRADAATLLLQTGHQNGSGTGEDRRNLLRSKQSRKLFRRDISLLQAVRHALPELLRNRICRLH